MDPIRVYSKLPVWTQNLAVSIYGARLRALRYGRRHRAALSELQESETRTAQEVRVAQDAQLFRTLVHAATAVPFYREQNLRLPGDASEAREVLMEWPVVEKADVQAAGTALIAEGHRTARLTKIHTGGTTGRTLAIWCDRGALSRNYAFFERFKRWAGIGPHDRVATFAGRLIVPPDASSPPYWRHNFAARQLLCSSYHISPTTVHSYLDALERFRPALIDSYPSSIEPLARAILARGGSDVTPRAIITSSETLFAEARSTIERAFKCRVFDHYGSAEMVAFVTQCEYGGYHPNREYGVLEVLDGRGSRCPDGQEGEIVATGFVNEVMPLIRYRMGDLAVRSGQRCACGRPYPLLDRLSGRVDDVVVTPEGRRVGRLDPIFKAADSLHEARIVQTALDHVRLELVAGDDFGDEDVRSLVQQLESRLGPSVHVHPERVSTIPRTKSGKLRTVVSPFGRSGATEHESQGSS